MIVPSGKVKRSLREAALSYHAQLKVDEAALTYLTQDRKLTNEALVHFGLGVVREPAPGHENFRNRISFPYTTAGGVTSIRFRRLGDGDTSKFLFITGDTARLYGITEVINQPRVFITEGEIDAITCWMAGIPAVGICGAKAWKPAFTRVFRNREVVVLADNDDDGSGKKMADKIYSELGGCDIILMDKGHDVSSYFAENGMEALREKVGL